MSAPCGNMEMVDVNMCNSCITCKNEISASEQESEKEKSEIKDFRDVLDTILKQVPDPKLVLKMLKFSKKGFLKLPTKSDAYEPTALEELIKKGEIPRVDELDYKVKFNALHFVAVHGARHKELNEKMKRILQRCTGEVDGLKKIVNIKSSIMDEKGEPQPDSTPFLVN